jgi:hypothetical protein
MPEKGRGNEITTRCPFQHTRKGRLIHNIAQSIPNRPLFHRGNPLLSITVIAMFHLPGREGQDLDRGVPENFLTFQESYPILNTRKSHSTININEETA